MKQIFLVCILALCVPMWCATGTEAAVTLMGRSYDARTVYAGPFTSQALYYRNPGSTLWQRGFDWELGAVTCRSAAVSFRSSGTWQGHLKADGSCAHPAEPSDWATGNRLNYDGVPAANKR